MICNFKHKGLRRFFLHGMGAGIQARHAAKLKLVLSRLDSATHIADINAPGLHLHELSGPRAGVWSVRISGNWRITFRFIDGDAIDVNLEDYH